MYLDFSSRNPKVLDAYVEVLSECLLEAYATNLSDLAIRLIRKAESVSCRQHHSLNCEELEALRNYCKSIAPIP